MIRRIGVLIPARDEQRLLPAALDALARAAARCPLPVSVVVIADGCVDATARVAADAGAQVIELDARCVGRARGAGADALIAELGIEGTWLATTDADSRVPEHWLARHARLAADGADAIVGTVQVTDWSGYPASVRRRYARRYVHADGHRHVHGANLGLSAAAYRAVGGFPALAAHEDVAVVAALEAGGFRIAWAGDLAVTTSARRVARAPDGFARHLRSLAAGRRRLA